MLYYRSICNITVIGTKHEDFRVSPLKDDEEGRPNVKYAIISWKPGVDDIGFHLACITAVDNKQ